MPVYQYEAMDNTGLEIKESIEAPSEAEATAKIREKGFFVTKIAEKKATKKKGDAKGKKGGAKAPARTGPKKKKTFSLGKVKAKHLCTFTRQLSTLQDAGLPVLRSLRILEGQSKPGPLKNALMGGDRRCGRGQHPLRSDGPPAEMFRQPLRQHGQGG